MKLCSRTMLACCVCIAALTLSTRATYGQTEACCLTNGTCQDLLVISCTDLGGTPLGPGTTCATTTCPDPVPAVSHVGLVALLLLTAVAGVIVIRRNRRGDVVA